MQELAQQEPAIPTPKMDFTTTTASAHVAYDLTGMSVGSRVMKTQNGELISPGADEFDDGVDLCGDGCADDPIIL